MNRLETEQLISFCGTVMYKRQEIIYYHTGITKPAQILYKCRSHFQNLGANIHTGLCIRNGSNIT